MIDYAGNKISVEGCYGCAYANHKFSLPCGMVYEDEMLTLSQDWELPINGFMVVCPKRHVEYFTQLTQKEIHYLFKFVHKTQVFLKELKVCDEFDIVVSERKGIHLHFCISPKHKWMKKMYKSPTDHFEAIFDYAKQNCKTNENIKDINTTVALLQKKFKA